jgi:hypothetical protein
MKEDYTGWFAEMQVLIAVYEGLCPYLLVEIVIGCLEKDILASVASLSDVVWDIREHDSGDSWHV